MNDNNEPNDSGIDALLQNLMQNLRSELDDVKSSLSSDIKKEIENVRSELKSELDDIRTSLKVQADSIQSNFTQPETDNEEDPPGQEAFHEYQQPQTHGSPPSFSPFRQEDRNFEFENNGTPKEYTFSNFTGIHFTGAFKTKITKAESYSVSINANDKLFRNIKVTQDGHILEISHSRHLGWKAGLSKLEVTITLPVLTELKISGATSAHISGFNSSDPFRLDTSGACKLTGNLTAGSIDFDISGAAKVDLAGASPEAIIKVSGASKMDLADFIIDHAAIKLSGASNMSANVTGKLDARLSGTTSFTWSGDAIMGDIRTSGLASMHKA